MINESTVLRFHFESQESARIHPSILAQIVSDLEQIVVSSAAGLAELEVRAFIVASPRSGSIEIHIEPVFIIQTVNVNIEAQTPPKLQPNMLKIITTSTGVGALFWAICFGQNGLVDLFYKRHHGQTVTSAERERQELIDGLISSKVGDHLLKQLTTNAMRVGAERVEIQVPDERSVIIFDGRGRARQGLIGKNAVVQKDRPSPPRISRKSDELIPVQFEGREYLAFVGEYEVSRGERYSYVVLWGSKRAVPERDQGAEIRSQVVRNPAEIIPSAAVPPQFEDVAGVILVNQSSEWD